MTKEEYLAVVQEIRAMLDGPSCAACSCPNDYCEWHGKCEQCVRIHRHFGDHLPNCLQFILVDKVKALAQTVELNVERKPYTPKAYWDYVNEVAPLEEKP